MVILVIFSILGFSPSDVGMSCQWLMSLYPNSFTSVLLCDFYQYSGTPAYEDRTFKTCFYMRIRKNLGYFLVPLKVVQLCLFFWHQTGWRISVELELYLIYVYHRPLYLYRGLGFLWCLFWFYSSFSLPRVSMPSPSSVFFLPSSSLFVLDNLISCAFTSFLRLLAHIFRLPRLLRFFVPLLLCLCYLWSDTIF